MTTVSAPTTAPPHRSLQAGDEVYFHNPQRGVLFGSVAGVGRDGATVDVQDEDGSTSVDESGKRGFRQGEVPEPEALGKALGGPGVADEEQRLVALVRAAVAPLQAAMAAMQDTHRLEMERRARIVETVATRPPAPLKASRTKDGGMLTRPATDADLAEVSP